MSAVAAGLGVLALVVGWTLRDSRRSKLRARLVPGEAPAPRQAANPSIRWSFKESKLPAWMRWLGSDFRRAGFRLGSAEMALFMILTALVAGGAVHVAFGRPLWTAVASGIGFWLPKALVGAVAAYRIVTLERQLADALDSVVASLQAGVGLRQALEAVRLHHRKPIAVEFDAMLRLMDAGASASDVFHETAILLRSSQFDLFAATMAAKWDAGGNVTPMLAGLSRRIRDTIRLRRRVLSLTAEARFSAVVLFIAPWALGALVWWRAPETLVFLWRHELGGRLVELAVALQFVGIVWMSRLLRRENI